MTYDYEKDLRRRLGIIQNMAPDVAPRVGSAPAGYQGGGAGYQGGSAANTTPTGRGGGAANITPTGRGGNSFDNFMNAIAAQESGGNYNARGIRTRWGTALGKYQILDSNIPSWSRGALGRSVSVNEFLNNPRIQDAIARWQLQNYYNKYGPAGAAVAWYSGEGNASRYLRSRGQGYNSRQNGGQFPSINEYAQAILRRMGRL